MTNPNDPVYLQKPEKVWSMVESHAEMQGAKPELISETYGLTKREYFAAMAMQGILANLHTYEKGRYMREGVQVTPSATLLAIDLADALIAELNKEAK